MNIKGKSLFSVAIAGCAVALCWGAAKNADRLRLLNPEYDFGIIREADGERTGTARLVNESADTTYIRDVRPSCGCTGASYNDAPLAPGDTTLVAFTYDPAGRPGHFSKSVKIYVGNSDERHTVRLFGTVLGTPQTLSRNYPVECGPLRLSEDLLEVPDVKEGTARHTFVRMVNQSADSISPSWSNPSEALSISVVPEKLGPGDIGTLGIYFNTRLEPRSGTVEYDIPFRALPDSSASTQIRLRAIILPKDSL